MKLLIIEIPQLMQQTLTSNYQPDLFTSPVHRILHVQEWIKYTVWKEDCDRYEKRSTAAVGEQGRRKKERSLSTGILAGPKILGEF